MSDAIDATICGDDNPIIQFEPVSKNDFDRLKSRVDNLAEWSDSINSDIDNHRVRMDAIANNSEYLHDYLQANQKDHEAMLENCQRILPLVKKVEQFIEFYRPVFEEVRNYLASKLPVEAPEGTECQTT